MLSARSQSQKGFSLIELLIYIALSLVVMTSLYQMLSSNQATYVSGESKIDVQQNARLVMDEITRHLRMTGYYPENFDDDATNNLTDTNPIQIATNGALALSGDVDGDGTSTIVYFCLDGTTVRRRKDASGDLSSYTCGEGDILGENISSLSFAYYDEDNVSIPDPATAPYELDDQEAEAVPEFSDMTQRDAIRRVVVTITGRQEVLRQATQIYTLTSDVRLRNVN
jgi:prepilin-type N-terminal cleavage/methylation domain-containing protein